MIAFFPQIYEDELAYSLFARYHVRSGHITYMATAEDLFKNADVIPSSEFLVCLTDDAYEIVTRQMGFETLIANHTMLAYYIRFLPLERRKKAFNLLSAMDRKFYDYLYMRRNKTARRRYMRYCPLCVNEDRSKYGETYWHRKHQLTGIDICLNHRCRLEDSTTGITNESLRFQLIAAETVIPSNMDANFNVSELECRVAEYVLKTFEAPLDLENDVAIGNFLHSKLGGTPYTSARGEQVFARRLFADLSEFYKDLSQNTFQEWWYVQKVFCSQNFHTYDICLLAMFLGIDVNALLNMTLPEIPLHQQFDNQVLSLHEQGLTYKEIAETMEVSVNTVKSVGEKRYRSTRESIHQ